MAWTESGRQCERGSLRGARSKEHLATGGTFARNDHESLKSVSHFFFTLEKVVTLESALPKGASDWSNRRLQDLQGL